MNSDFGPLPTEHPRDSRVRDARIHLEGLVLSWSGEANRLTYAEQIHLLAEAQARLTASILRAERRERAK
jgi:CelD/BcsL family acetyltransferase involved in cellulose biosynthesis